MKTQNTQPARNERVVYFVSPLGVEPKFPASQASVLSIERRGHAYNKIIPGFD